MQMVPAPPGAKAFVLESRGGQQRALSDLSGPHSRPVPTGHVGERIGAAHTSHSTSPPKAGQMWSTQPVLHSRQSGGTPIGLILGGAQDAVSINCRPFGVCLFLPLRNGGRLGPRFCTAQQGHPALILTDRSHHKMADGLHSCSASLRKSEKTASLQ